MEKKMGTKRGGNNVFGMRNSANICPPLIQDFKSVASDVAFGALGRGARAAPEPHKLSDGQAKFFFFSFSQGNRESVFFFPERQTSFYDLPSLPLPLYVVAPETKRKEK